MSVVSNERVISFGPFQLYPTQRLLLEGGRSLRLGSRALELLISLVERAGELVSKEELMAQVWPNTIVEENNLKVQVSVLRRALADRQGGNRYILTIPGRGYSFVAPIASTDRASAAPVSTMQLPNPQGAPSPIQEDRVWIIALATISCSDSVPGIAAHGFELRTDDLLGGLIAALRRKQMSLTLDDSASASFATGVCCGPTGTEHRHSGAPVRRSGSV